MSGLLLAALVTAVIAAVIVAVVLLTFDCDFFLWATTHFGKTPDVMRGQVVWITGASSGIGEELAYVLAAAGTKLVLSARREPELERVKKRCVEKFKMRPEDVLVLPLDLLQFDSHKAAVDTVLQHFNQVDVLVNNAGQGQGALVKDTSLEVDRALLEVNTLGPLSLTKAVLPHMLARRSGHVVVVSSAAGKMEGPGMGSYAGSKHALHGWFDTLRMELTDDNIDVTIVCPGPVHSAIDECVFTGELGKEFNKKYTRKGNLMATSRCAYLSAVAIANQTEEVWISNQPVLSFFYLRKYLPTLPKWLRKKAASSRMQKLKRLHS